MPKLVGDTSQSGPPPVRPPTLPPDFPEIAQNPSSELQPPSEPSAIPDKVAGITPAPADQERRIGLEKRRAGRIASRRRRMAAARHASHRMDALERRIAKLEAQSRPLGKTCPQCHAFGLESYVLRTAFGGQGLQMMRCRFCDFAEEKMPASASSLPRAAIAAKDRSTPSTTKSGGQPPSATNRPPSRTTAGSPTKKPRASVGLDRGADWRAWAGGELRAP
jgi:hypothetical protein